MSAQSSFAGFIEDLAVELAGYGFERGEAGRVFRRFSPEGDVLIFEVQPSDHSSRGEKVFYINIGLVLAAKWEWDRQRTGRPASELPRHYNGGWRRRLRSGGLSGEDQWRIADEDSAARVTAMVRQRLEKLLPQLLLLLDRDVVLNETPDILGPGAWLIRAWLLAGEGRIDELAQLLFVERPAHTRDSVPVRTVWNYATGRAPDTGQR
ncbi:DUF4304 domain-containing protein [Verrucosispora sp. ts21]|uniref:DUF4304 domain-containing protein n=1 Tax=Verrucosispora sp. ts21 TaxID=2069341 RepID=UPI001E3CC466|nr:DUF4304 domain-containing protein [Verrucosispora sp. ts21]